MFTAARKSALNSLALTTIGVKDGVDSIPGGQVLRDDDGDVRLIAGASSHLRQFIPRTKHAADKVQASLQNVHHHYNMVGITSIFERAGTMDDLLIYRKMRDEVTFAESDLLIDRVHRKRQDAVRRRTSPPCYFFNVRCVWRSPARQQIDA